jgi:hypothetical protein
MRETPKNFVAVLSSSQLILSGCFCWGLLLWSDDNIQRRAQALFSDAGVVMRQEAFLMQPR